LCRPGRYALDGQRVTCGAAPTVLYPNLNDYAESFPKFIVVRPDLMAKPATPVKLWIYYHECGHVMRGPDTNVADCYGIERRARGLAHRTRDERNLRFHPAGHRRRHPLGRRRALPLDARLLREGDTSQPIEAMMADRPN
jgi:hypothetical protein